MMAPQDIGGCAMIVAIGVSALLMGLGRRIARKPCQHKWQRFSEMSVHPRARPEVMAGTMYGLSCEKCGEITRRYVGLS